MATATKTEVPVVPLPPASLAPPPMTTGQACAKCFYFDGRGGGDRQRRGVCRRNPPPFMVVSHVEWCGEFKAR